MTRRVTMAHPAGFTTVRRHRILYRVLALERLGGELWPDEDTVVVEMDPEDPGVVA